MPLLLQARITSVSFEEARYRHYRAQQRREGALRKAALLDVVPELPAIDDGKRWKEVERGDGR